jgi:hypothetical protein
MGSARRPIRRVLLPLGVIAIAVSGCGRRGTPAEQVSDQTLRSEYARMIQQGLTHDGLTIAARTIDPNTGDLLDFRIESATHMMSARRARLVFDLASDTLSFELTGVVVAQTDSQSTPLARVDRLTTSPVAAGRDVRGGASLLEGLVGQADTDD